MDLGEIGHLNLGLWRVANWLRTDRQDGPRLSSLNYNGESVGTVALGIANKANTNRLIIGR